MTTCLSFLKIFIPHKTNLPLSNIIINHNVNTYGAFSCMVARLNDQTAVEGQITTQDSSFKQGGQTI